MSRRVKPRGWYCEDCGATYTHPGAGFITCQRCGSIGLRGFEGHLRRIGCADHPDWRGWDDGGVNDDLRRHQRAFHPVAAAPGAPEAGR